MNVYLLGAGLVTGGILARKLITTTNLKNNLVVDFDLTPKKVVLNLLNPGIVLQVDVKLINPTKGTLKVNHPFVAIAKTEKDAKENSFFTYSDPTGKVYTIPADGYVKLDPITFEILGYDSVMAIANVLTSSKAFFIKYRTTANLLLTSMKIEDIIKVPVSKNKTA